MFSFCPELSGMRSRIDSTIDEIAIFDGLYML